ncbi:hypothetical protein [Maricaulis sp. W15]|uniref:hypothetical protein n=1 Tax=Maricaulis sp. W15 TaxID=1772333 RepID=UPI0013019A78|nr:hypothetical protein [Maricaulis sp. W15]
MHGDLGVSAIFVTAHASARIISTTTDPSSAVPDSKNLRNAALIERRELLLAKGYASADIRDLSALV